ncbi:DNA polymerase family A-domain-containing protein [Lipomyces oligophaga]|uniref:DNA polymerase family A-domain-containing protein n=1 Tax=Lipomyces oligophaga TaxID=45792 RepID=UPI0034D00787
MRYAEPSKILRRLITTCSTRSLVSTTPSSSYIDIKRTSQNAQNASFQEFSKSNIDALFNDFQDFKSEENPMTSQLDDIPLIDGSRLSTARVSKNVLTAKKKPGRPSKKAKSKMLHLTPRMQEIRRKATEYALPVDEKGEKIFNEAGIQLLGSDLHTQVFPEKSQTINKQSIQLSREHLALHDLLGKKTSSQKSLSFRLPPLHGSTLDEHFQRIGKSFCEPYLSIASSFIDLQNLPPMPASWISRSGWTKYEPGFEPKSVDYPDGEAIAFDTEVLYKESPFAVIAVAMTKNAWFCWLSPWLLGESEVIKQLIPMGSHNTEQVIVGHNVSYDRIRVQDEYNFKSSKAMYMDTMSLHIACNGMSSQQRPTYMKYKKDTELEDELTEDPEFLTSGMTPRPSLALTEDEPWLKESSVNALRDVAKHHVGIKIDKSVRDEFGVLGRDKITASLDKYVEYCATDVQTTFLIFQKLFPRFLELCPHPISFSALRYVADEFLPINKSWDKYIKSAESTYQNLLSGLYERLVTLAENAVALRNQPEKFQSDPWLSQLDWTIKELRMTKGSKNKPSRPVKNQKLPGYPEWYRKLFEKEGAEMKISVRSRTAVILLRMSWDGNPLEWTDSYGWTFRAPIQSFAKFKNLNYSLCQNVDSESSQPRFKVPHKDGPSARCASPLAKGFAKYFEDKILTSEYSLGQEALKMNAMCSYWISARDRICSQVPIYSEDTDLGINPSTNGDRGVGIILPSIVPMGTITRRAVENTWLTASNAKKDRLGSELKAMVQAPDGYKFVGADVDSEELWIASLVGDSAFGMHGATAIGWMTLEGTKSAGTDLHSKTASILKISRNSAKIFNYGRIYGAGLSFAKQLLQQFNPEVTMKEAEETASELYKSTKGGQYKGSQTKKFKVPKYYWHGGTESIMFNKLEEIANEETPRTPVLGCAITDALKSVNLKKSSFMTSRINWTIQSSGVDYLHLLIISMQYLIDVYKIDARLVLTVHDEIRYLVKDEDKYRAAMALQVSNIWTRAMFCEQVGIYNLPQSCAFFSAVDIDTVIRKEVDMPCVTPSHPDPIPPGESLDINQLLEKPEAELGEPQVDLHLDSINVEQRPTSFAVMEQNRGLNKNLFRSSAMTLSYLSAQVSPDGRPYC